MRETGEKEGLEINNFDKVPQETFNKKIEVSNQKYLPYIQLLVELL